MKVTSYSGQQLAQIDNPDPFAPPAWRSPVYHTPYWVIIIVQVCRALFALGKFLARHPLLDLAAAVLVLAWRLAGWPGPVILASAVTVILIGCRVRWPGSFARFIATPARGRWRRWHYQRHWLAVLTIARLVPVFRGQVLVPVLGKVRSTKFTDRVPVRLVSGQAPADFANRAENLANGFGALLCRVRSARPGFLILEFVRRDALAAIIPALATPQHADLKALAIGRREDGSPWLLRLHGTHLLIAGATGAGKGSILWSLIRALLGLLQAGLVKILAADPKVMELAYGRAIFDTYGQYVAEPAAIVAMLEAAVADMRARAAQLNGKQRDHTPTIEFPFVVILVDEVAFLTAYQPDKNMRERVKAALATLTTQGRAVGYCVVAALQDPRKEVMSIRNLFPDRIAMRLDEPEQVDMVLGDGARDRGATSDLISTDSATGAGVAFVRLEADPDPVRVRAAWVADADIRAMATSASPRARPIANCGRSRGRPPDEPPRKLADRRPMSLLRHRSDGHRRRARPDQPRLSAVRLIVDLDRRPRNRGDRMTTTSTRAERMAAPLARDSIRKIAEASGGCLRPIQMRRTDTVTGQVEQVMKPCGATLASICPPCAERAKSLRAAQCREGWHLEDEPVTGPPAPDETQEYWLILRAEAQVVRDRAQAHGQATSELDELLAELDTEITRAGVGGTVTASTGSGKAKPRRSRSTRRRQDAPDLPKRKIVPQTVGRVFTAPDGKSYRPSMFLTLTCDSYGKVRDDGTPADPGTYDYTRAARDALHFSALTDRFIQNLRRTLGYDTQYFGAIEPQKRLAPHLHMAIRGAVPRAVLRQVVAGTYHQVWWPSTEIVRYDGDELPVWDEDTRTYLDPATGEVLPTWDQALDAIGPADDPLHVARFGATFDAQGVLAGSKDAARCIRYLTKYLTKQVADCLQADTDAHRAHMERLADALRYEPCSPTCANWLRYGIQPKNARPGLRPGFCKGKAHRSEHLGYAGRRVLVSRKWSGKTLADHRSDRKAWLTQTLGLEAPDPARYTWHVVTPSDRDYLPPDKRLLHIVADRNRWQAALDEARRRARDQEANLSATGRAA